jgi:hypothetical protein
MESRRRFLMSLENELYEIFCSSKATKQKKKTEPVTPPMSARLVRQYYDPRKNSRNGDNLLLVIKQTKARVYAWQKGVWSIVTAEEAHELMGRAQLEEDRRALVEGPRLH